MKAWRETSTNSTAYNYFLRNILAVSCSIQHFLNIYINERDSNHDG